MSGYCHSIDLYPYNRADISSLEDELRSCCTHTQWLQYNDEIESALSKHSALLTECRNKKIGNLTKKRQWSNRFRRHTNNDTSPHLVVNLILPSFPSRNLSFSLKPKGLKFCPTPPEVEQIALSQDLSTFYRRIRLKEVLDEPLSDPDPFYWKSTWTPPKNRVPSLEIYIQAVSSLVCSTDTLDIRAHDNLPQEERQALSSLKNRSDIIIKPADKGSAVVVMGRQQYIDEAMKHLNNQSHYALLDSDPTYFLRKLNDIKDQIPKTAIIGTFNVSSLNTSIPHDEGILAALAASGHSSPPISDIKSLMSHVLTKNNFTFMGKHYLQIFGTAMGTRMAPPFACLFVTKLEQQMLDSAPCRPWIWWRYKDDIFFIWTREEDSLHTFIDHINSFHRTIKFTSDFSQQETNILDVTVQKKPNGITTTFIPFIPYRIYWKNTVVPTLYSKPTDTHQYLHSSSCHPRHCKTGIAYSQALRLRRICSDSSEDPDFSFHTRNLQKHLCARGHRARAVLLAINKFRSLPRSEVLKPNSDKTTDRIPFDHLPSQSTPSPQNPV
ncbi:uncharacterized protein LOC121418037 [Lytechinus variegatus]|uniref:uncharacterized protein LOC121418037 n=1 Tax=Lytechinus variegatus TaxID=7654 RepID=UPI001BB19576|nr:uncharacterized protein LOC121418037 [Lytechinus variegatus]